MMGEGDGEEKDTALLLNSIVKGRRGPGCSTAAAAMALPVAAVAGMLIMATETAVQVSMVPKMVLVGRSIRSALGSFVSGFCGSNG